MSRAFAILLLLCFGIASFDACAAHAHKKPLKRKSVAHRNSQPHHPAIAKPRPAAKTRQAKRAKPAKSAEPVRNEEWYLEQARKSQGFRAVATENRDAEFLPKATMVDQAVQQATVSSRPVAPTEKAAASLVKKSASFPEPGKLTVIFVPPYVSNKLMDAQKNQNTPPMFRLSWQE